MPSRRRLPCLDGALPVKKVFSWVCRKRSGRETIALFPLFRVQQLHCNSLCEVPNMFQVWSSRQVFQLHPGQFHLLSGDSRRALKWPINTYFGEVVCNRSWFSGRGWGQQLFTFQSPAVHWIARTSSLNCLSCRSPYQTPHSLHCLPPFQWKPPIFTEKCFVASPLPKSALISKVTSCMRITSQCLR